MFQRAVRLREAEEALARGLWEEALRLASDPRIAGHRRAREVRRKARDALLERARHRLEQGNLTGAERDLERAGGEATLAEAVRDARKRVSLEKEGNRLLGDKARFFLRAGFPGKTLEILEGRNLPGKESLSRLAREARERAGEKSREARARLREGDLAGAVRACREAWRLDRGQAPAREVGEALLSRAFSGREKGSLSLLEEGRRLLEEEAWLEGLPAFRAWAEKVAPAALEEARSHLEKGNLLPGGKILELLDAFPLPRETWSAWLELLGRKTAWELLREGRGAEAAGLAKAWGFSLSGAFPPGKEKEVELREERVLQEIFRSLGEGGTGEIPRGLEEAFPWAGEILAGEIQSIRTSSEEAWKKGAAFLEEGRPGDALRAFLLVRVGKERREKGIGESLARMRAAREKLGAWRAELARLGEPPGPPGGGSPVEEASRLDREVPGLEEAFREWEEARAFLSHLGESGEEVPLEEAVRRFCAPPLVPPAGAFLLTRLGRERLNALCRRALEEGAGKEEALLLGRAREGWGLSPDPAFPSSLSSSPGPGETQRGGEVPSPLEGFFLRVAGRGDLLVLPRESLVLGSAPGGKADLPVLAGIGSREVEFSRKMTFHEGISFRVRSLSGKPFRLDGEGREEGRLSGGSVLEVGPVLRVVFRRPVKTSATVLLEFSGDFDVEGCRRAAWMKIPGWDGALVLGPDEDSHVRIPGAGARLEIGLDGKGRFLMRSTHPIRAGGRELGKEGTFPGFGQVRTGGILLFLDPRVPFSGRGDPNNPPGSPHTS